MQGTSSAAEVIDQLGRLDRDPAVDVIVIARGGGSVEDLLPFSDEGLLRAVFAARTPVVSAIGHEPDSPLLDLVADVRASTPTDAAKLVVPDVAEETQRVQHLRDRSRQLIAAWLAREQHALDTVRARPALADPGSGLAARADEVDALRDRARRTLHHQLDRAGNDLGHQLARARGMSPLATLQRGYAVLQDAEGHVVTSVAAAATDQRLQVRVVDGRIAVTVTGTETATLTDPEERP
jgi:exodeoxyribonuclease VII large subunit